ncbi:hypothetical protein ACH5RR_030341 [Cinchona calisaya]|uniref:Uncharacterized protein n=1 Tax=Cinchona calisaya TaxID=153742 RepID=A0ABD2YY12_9GENT
MAGTQQNSASNFRNIPMLKSSRHSNFAPQGTFTLTMSSADSAKRPSDLAATKYWPLDNISHRLAFSADMHLRRITESEEAFVKISSSTMGYQTAPLHLTKLYPAESLSVCHWLTSEWMDWSSIAKLHFVFSHMSTGMIECGSHENHGKNHFTRSTVVNSLISHLQNPNLPCLPY